MSMQLEGSLMGNLCIKAELFKVIQSVWGKNRASHKAQCNKNSQIRTQRNKKTVFEQI